MQTGQGVQTPERVLTVKFNPDTQQVSLAFESADFKTWDMVIGLLKMAELNALQAREVTIMQAMQAQMQQQMHGRAIEQAVRGRLIH